MVGEITKDSDNNLNILIFNDMKENNDTEQWVMPDYLEKYRGLINNTGGIEIEKLMNDKKTTAFNNMFRAVMITSVDSQIQLLERLHKCEYLKWKLFESCVYAKIVNTVPVLPTCYTNYIGVIGLEKRFGRNYWSVKNILTGEANTR